MKKSLFGYLFLFFSLIAFAQTPEEQIEQSAQAWKNAIDSRNAQSITALYDPNAILYATFESMHDTQASIQGYFDKLVKHPKLTVRYDKQNVRIFGETAINSGLYTFSYENNGKITTVPARFTFVYNHTPKGWLIVEHHSSELPD